MVDIYFTLVNVKGALGKFSSRSVFLLDINACLGGEEDCVSVCVCVCVCV